MPVYFTDVVDAITPAWMRYPGWRWERAMRYTLGGDAMLLRDPYINDMAKVYRCTGQRYERAIAASCPEAYSAYLLHAMHSHRGGAKWQVEAYLLAGADNDFLQSKLPMPVGADAYEFYRNVYFDVTDQLKYPNCILSSVLGYSSGMSDAYADQDIAWKMFAYTQGLEAFDELLFHYAGGTMNFQLQQYMRDFQHSRALYYGYHIVQNAKLCFQEQLQPILGLARTQLGVGASSGGDATEEGSNAFADMKAKQLDNCVRHILGNIDVSLRNRNNSEVPVMPAGARERLLQPSEKVNA